MNDKDQLDALKLTNRVLTSHEKRIDTLEKHVLALGFAVFGLWLFCCFLLCKNF